MAHGPPKVERAGAIHDLLPSAGWSEAKRRTSQGDASTRAYERLTLRRRHRHSDDLAERGRTVRPCGWARPTALSPSWRKASIRSSPWRTACARRASARLRSSRGSGDGLLLIEDLGNEAVIEDGGPIPGALRRGSRRARRRCIGRDLPTSCPSAKSRLRDPALRYRGDADRSRAGARLVRAARHRVHGVRLRAQQLRQLWREALEPILPRPATWTLSDYHSPNLIWLPERDGAASASGSSISRTRCSATPPTMSSRCCRTPGSTVPEDLELKLLGHYARAAQGRRPRLRHGRFRARLRGARARSATPRSSASSPVSTGATASRNICGTCRGSRPISARDLSHPALAD